MGRILGIKANKKENILLEVEISYEEFLQLKGHIKNIYIFSEDCIDINSNLSQRGKNDATKYFLIPKNLRKGLRFVGSVKCKKLETESKSFFVYVIDKINMRFIEFIVEFNFI